MQVHTPVVPTQGVYRQLLQAMSHPGRLHVLPTGAWASSLLAVCETLLDHEVSFSVAPGGDPAWETDIFALTKARIAPPDMADYLVIKGPDSGGVIEEAKIGDPAFPDRGATLLYVLDGSLPDGDAPVLSGPGLAQPAPPEVNALSNAEWRRLRTINEEYPLGVDAICLLGDDQVLCLPRSTRIEVE